MGFIHGRQAPDGTRRLINLISQAEFCRTPSLLLSLDAEKVFYRVHLGYLQTVLNTFGIKGWIQKAILSLYSTPLAIVLNSGITSKPIQITNGTKQGCPLSPIIFTHLMEPLAESIRSHPNITGISVAGEEHKISLFADDVMLMISNPKTSLPETQKILTEFSALSCYKLNATKS